MKTILVNPPSPGQFQANRDFMGGYGAVNARGVTRVPVTLMESCAGMLLNAGCEVDIVDGAVIDDPAEIWRGLAGAGCIGIYPGTATYDADLLFADECASRTGALVFVFGPQATCAAQIALGHEGIKAVVEGEPERTVLELVRAWSAGRRDLTGIAGLRWRDPAGAIHQEPARGFEGDLDTFPFSYRPLKSIGRYFYRAGEHPFISVVSSRGCPFACIYCPYPASQGAAFRSRSPRHVVDELVNEYARIPYRMVLFRDPVFTFDHARTLALCRLLRERLPGLTWRCETATSVVDAALLAEMRSAGCAGINFGVETGSPDLLNRFSRKTGGVDRVRTVFRECARLGIETTGFFMVGLPGETRATLAETLAFAVELEPTEVNFTAATPFPGTELYRQLCADGTIAGNEFSRYDTSRCLTGTDALGPDDLQKEIVALYSRFYGRPRRLWFEARRDPALFARKVYSMARLIISRRSAAPGEKVAHEQK